MKAIFRGGPWDGCEIDFPVLPQWISLGATVWNDKSGYADVQDTQILAAPVDFTYVLHRDGSTLCYEMKFVEHE
jgi:hypothetical protein